MDHCVMVAYVKCIDLRYFANDFCKTTQMSGLSFTLARDLEQLSRIDIGSLSCFVSNCEQLRDKGIIENCGITTGPMWNKCRRLNFLFFCELP